MTFDLFDTINGSGVPCTTDMLMATIDTQKMRDRVRAVRDAVAAGRKDDAARLKKRLPAVTWQAHFPDGKRRSEGALSSGLYMLDIDHVDDVERTIAALIESATEQCLLDQIVAIHISPSGQGIRVVAVCSDPQRDTIEKNQAWLAEKLGVLAYDATCKDFARLAFLVAYEDFRYLNLNLLSKEAEVRLNNNLFSPESVAEEKERVKSAQQRLFTDEQKQFCYKGMLISDIAQKYLDYFGRPQEGERNTYYYNMCVNFRYITDHNIGIMLAQLPDVGLSITERQKVVESSVKKTRGGRIPYIFWKFLEGLGLVQSFRGTGKIMSDEEVDDRVTQLESQQFDFPPMPVLFREYCNSVPNEFKWPMTAALLPILGTLTTRVRATYLDGKEHSTTFHSVVIAPASSGKSIFADAFHALTADLIKRDNKEWEKERVYQLEMRRKKNAKEMPQNPHITLRLLQPSISVPKLLERQQDADGLHQLTFTPEVDTLAKTNKGKAGMDKNDMYRQAWDNDWYGQDYMMSETFSGQVRLYQNFLLTGTPKQVENFYGDPENGLVSRVMFAHIQGQDYATMPVFKKFSPSTEKKLNDLLKRVDATCYSKNENGKEIIKPLVNIDDRMAFMRKPLEDWLERNRIKALAEADLARDNFRKRAAVKAFRAAMVAVSLYQGMNKVRCDLIRDWALWIADMDLQEHIDMYAGQFVEEDEPKDSTVNGMLESLNDRFTGNDLSIAMQKAGRKSQVPWLIHNWKKAGLITKVGKGMYEKTNRCKKIYS